jgi:hypothetical protein
MPRGVFIVSANTHARREDLREKLNSCFDVGVKVTGATLKITSESSYDEYVPNHALGRSYRRLKKSDTFKLVPNIGSTCLNADAHVYRRLETPALYWESLGDRKTR